jgi:hypothetical protein
LTAARPYLAAAGLALLPFAAGLLAGDTLFFRDLALYFFPSRQFVAEGLRAGELRYWNPYVYEGIPVALPPVSYPLELLQALAPTPRGLSLWLIFHMPAAAAAFVFLALRLGLRPLAAVGGAALYTLGGFPLSSISLNVYPPVIAWAPLAIAAFIGLREHPRYLPLAAITAAMMVSTTGIELAIQGVLMGVVLAGCGAPRFLLRVASALALAVALVAPTLVYIGGVIAQSARGAGLETQTVLAYSVHPLTFLQTMIASLHGDLSNPTARWWGQNFFPHGFPYMVSLYLGAVALSCAATGAVHAPALRRRLLLLALAGAWICLGRWGGLEPIVAALEPLRKVRYPVKAFFMVHTSLALLAALGLDALLREGDPGRRAFRTFRAVAAGAGGLLLALQAVPLILPGLTRWFAAGFFPPAMSGLLRAERLRFVLGDAAVGGAVALAAALAAALVLRGRLRPAWGAAGVAALLTADLLRSSSGLNPTVAPALFTPSPEMSAQIERMRGAPEPGRVFTCGLEQTPAYFAARRQHGLRQDTFTVAALLEGLTPYFNVPLRVPAAYGIDITMLVPRAHVFTPREVACTDMGALLARLRPAGVHHVMSVVPLTHPDLELAARAQPARIAPLSVWIYSVRAPLPLQAVTADAEGTQRSGSVVARAETPGHLELTVEAPAGGGYAIVRSAGGPGWSARVDDAPAEVLSPSLHHQAVRVPGGRSRVRLDYRPAGLRPAVLLSAAALAVLIGLGVRARRRGSYSSP